AAPAFAVPTFWNTAGATTAASAAMMASTTSSSRSVKASRAPARVATALDLRNTQHLLDGGQPATNLGPAIRKQWHHAFLERQCTELGARGPLGDRDADVVAHAEQLIDSNAATISGSPARHAPCATSQGHRCHRRARDQRDRLGTRLVAHATDVADPSHEPLRENALERANEQILRDAEVHEPRNGSDRVIGVERREYQMSRHGGLDCDLRRLHVTHLADHDHIRILPQNGAQCAGECDAGRMLHWHLRDVLDLVFDGVLD